jgi:F-type H+-transporting ATPase subunit gamma
MESPETLLRSIENTQDLQQIVGTMKALSAVSIRQYERAAQALAEYERTVQLGLMAVLHADAPHWHTPGPSARGSGCAAVVFGTDHGLCGRFNEAIVEHVAKHLQEHPCTAERRWLAVGERIVPVLERQTGGDIQILTVPSSAGAITSLVQRVLMQIDAWRQQEVSRVELFHQEPTGRAGYRPRTQRLFPLDPDNFQRNAEQPWPSRSLPQFSMNRERLLSQLVRQHYFVVLFRACAESLAAEHGSRLAAMQAAEKNVDERLEEVTGRFRRVRQERITSELLDVVSGFEAAS